jgi:hypothetical protein
MKVSDTTVRPGGLIRCTPRVVVAAVFFALLVPMQAHGKDKSDDTITLVCSTNYSRAATPATIDLNEAEAVVTVHYYSIDAGGGRILPARTSGPLAARFTKNTITFVDRLESRRWDFMINRLTGIIDVIETQEGQKFPFVWTCHVGKAQF